MKRKRQWAPYILILPSIIYLAIFFAWPMIQALRLAIWDNDGVLTLRADASQESRIVGRIPQGSQVDILGQQGNLVQKGELDQTNAITERWFNISGTAADGSQVQGWTSDSRIRVREESPEGVPLSGTVRRKLATNVDPLTDIYAEPNVKSAVVGRLEANVTVVINETAILEVWFQLESTLDGQTVTGWAPSRFIQVFGEEARGRVDRGNAGIFTTEFINKMVNDRFFMPALRTTLLLMVIIIPVQFVLAIIMALVIQARLRGNSLLLYIFAIPLGVSDLAVGIVWFAIFTQSGFLNSILLNMGLIKTPLTFLSAETRQWIIVAIFLAEVWRATSIVMIIVVSGLQAISQEVLEAAELFGADLWQRIRHVILPLLKPSLQVALILRTILALQVFAVVIALSGGDVVTVLANETYRQYYDFRNPNVAAAYAGLILLLSMVSAIVYLRLVRTQEEVAS
jgi:multiple sugar transport system permease protein